MATSQSPTAIANRALQKIGARSITSMDENSAEARAAVNCYDFCRRAELRAHRWNFARKRAVLAPSSDAPSFGFTYSFPLPADCLYILQTNDWDDDWQVEGRAVLTNSDVSPSSVTGVVGSPALALTYVSDVTDATLFDASFAETLSARMAMEMVERLTQSNQKAQKLEAEYKFAIAEAAAANAFEQLAADPPEDDWIVARGFG